MASIQKRVGKKGVTWRVVVRSKGQPPQTKSFPTRTRAEQWARTVETDIDTGAFKPADKTITRKLFERYRDEVSPKHRGHRREKIFLDMLIRDAKFMAKPVSQVGGQDIQTWRDARLLVVSSETVNRELNVVSAVFSQAIKEWRIKMRGNPVHDIKRPPRGRRRDRRVAPDELSAIQRYFSAAETGTTKSLVHIMFELAIETAMRLSELAALLWSNVNLREGWVYILKTKNDDNRYVPLTPRGRQLIGQLEETDLRVFPVNADTVGVYFHTACVDLKIVDLHFHDSRHEATTRLARRLEVLDLAAVTGHRDLKSLQIYYNPTPAELAERLA